LHIHVSLLTARLQLERVLSRMTTEV